MGSEVNGSLVFQVLTWRHTFLFALCTHKRFHNHLMSLNRWITVWEPWRRATHGVTKAGNNCCWSYKVRNQRKLKSNVFQFFLFHTHSLLFGGTWQAFVPTGNHQASKWNWEINIINAFAPQTLTHNTHKKPICPAKTHCGVERIRFPVDVPCNFVHTVVLCSPGSPLSVCCDILRVSALSFALI